MRDRSTERVGADHRRRCVRSGTCSFGALAHRMPRRDLAEPVESGGGNAW
jgi:hypothetical protein